MTMTMEQGLATARGEDARKVIDTYRDFVDEHFRIEALEAEFPAYAHELGARGLFLARAGDNLAGTFKWRGAMNGAVHLANQGFESLVVPSAGNHARGAVLAAKALSLGVHVVVPESAPPAKKEGLRELWDNPKLRIHTAGNSFDDAKREAMAHPEYGALLHPYDDPHVASGQGTIIDDLLEKHADTQHIVVPVGGGGLLGGVLHRLEELKRQDITVHGVEATGSNSLSRSLDLEKATSADAPNRRYGGSAVRDIGNFALDMCRRASNFQLHTASETEVDHLIATYEQDRYDLMRQNTPNYEPTSLVAMAGLRGIASQNPGEKIVVIGTGHNDSLQPKVPQRRLFNV